MAKPFVKKDKLGRICAILYKGSTTTPDELKPTLNMFQGRQLKTSLSECLYYAELSLAAQQGDEEAEKELNYLHYNWNHNEDKY